MRAPAHSRSLACRLGASAVLALCAGCSVVTGIEGVSYRNARNQGDALHQSAWPVPRAVERWQADKDLFVGVAISGGGSRSANFGMAALAELEALGILEHVDAISAVSGGSIPTALFALDGDQPGWAERGRAKVGTDMLRPLVGRLLNPVNALATTFTDRDRSDTMAEIFEDKLFDGRRVRFGDLGARGPMRPAIYFNATDSTDGGRRFVFTEESFVRLGSELGAYPLAWAMAASAAFPGAFNSVTLRRHPLDASAPRGEARYLHLIDGGVSDNLGVETLIEKARAQHISALRRGREPRGCLMILIDSHVPSTTVSESLQSDRRNVASMLIDLNFLDAIDGMLSNRRDDTLARVGIRRADAVGLFDIEIQPGLVEKGVRPYRRIGEFEIGYLVADGLPFATADLSLEEGTLAFEASQRIRPARMACQAWHVSLADLQSIVPWREREGRWERLSLDAPADQPVFAARARLARLIEQVSTSHHLTGPAQCNAPTIQQALFDAAHIAVRQDKDSLERVCGWFAERGLATGGRCRAEAAPLGPDGPAMEPIRLPRSDDPIEQRANRFMRCVDPGGPAAPLTP
jgi:NTE family protein